MARRVRQSLTAAEPLRAIGTVINQNAQSFFQSQRIMRSWPPRLKYHELHAKGLQAFNCAPGTLNGVMPALPCAGHATSKLYRLTSKHVCVKGLSGLRYETENCP